MAFGLLAESLWLQVCCSRMLLLRPGYCRALSTRCDAPEKASRPWDKDRDGFVMGEGAGVLVLESLEHARNRGAPILAEYLGGAFTCDAHHMTDPRPDGLGVSTCIELALRNSRVDKDRVSLTALVIKACNSYHESECSRQRKSVLKPKLLDSIRRPRRYQDRVPFLLARAVII